MTQSTIKQNSPSVVNTILKSLVPALLVSLLATTATLTAFAGEKVEVFKNPSCGCCTQWAEHMRKSGFDVVTQEVNDVASVRRSLGMPERLGACHTAKVGGYLVEGHVPADDVKRLLRERPKAIGLAVPSMPPGSPGMESAHPVPYETLLVQANGDTKTFAKH